MLKSTSFVFDGQSSEEYGLMIYFSDTNMERNLDLGTKIDIIEDRLSSRISPIHYGTDINKGMTFSLTFGSTEYLSDYEVDAILGWLTGHNTYKYLEYVNGDHYVRYKCFLNNMKTVYTNGLATSFSCDVVCDGQFAYEYPIKQEININETETILNMFNRSSYNGYLKPKLDIYFADDCNSLSIINETDNDREFKINYFDRVLTEDNVVSYNYDTTLSDVLSQDLNGIEYFSWDKGGLPDGDWNDLLYGENIYVLLPVNSDKAQISLDRCLTWQEISLPCAGTFTGCYGASGFVAIRTDVACDTVLYSQNGVTWTQISNDSCLPVKQKWNSVCFAKIDTFSDGYFVAVGESSIAACSLSGLNWRALDVTLPDGNWNKVSYGNGRVIAISSNTNKVAYCTSITKWRELEIPVSANWQDITYGRNGWVIIANTVSSANTQPLCLFSRNGVEWVCCELPINSWRSVSYCENSYIIVSSDKYAKSSNGQDWILKDLPCDVKFTVADDNNNICVGESILFSSLLSVVNGSFSFDIGEDNIVSDLIISAKIDDASDLSSDFSSNGEIQLYMQQTDDSEEYIADYTIMTTDLRNGLDSEGVKLKAYWDGERKNITVEYICNPNHTSVVDALLNVNVTYKLTLVTDLGMDGLHLSFDNQNQIITTNRSNLNPYKYFNMKFLRFLKGNNLVKLKTDGGSATLIITWEFLRKVGGF